MKAIKLFLLLILFFNVFSADDDNSGDSTFSGTIMTDLINTNQNQVTPDSGSTDANIDPTEDTIKPDTSKITEPTKDTDIKETSSENLDKTIPTNLEENKITDLTTISPTNSDNSGKSDPTNTPPFIFPSDLTDTPTTNNSSNSTDPTPNSGQKARIILLGFGSFLRPQRDLVTFRVYFKRFLYRLISNLLSFTVNVNYLRRLRVLGEQKASCTLTDSTVEDEDLIYNCNVAVDPDKNFTMSAKDDFIFGNDTQEIDFVISSYANKTMNSLNEQNGDIFKNGVITLDNSILTSDENTFTIEGELQEGKSLNDKQITLSLNENGDSNGNLVNATCKVNNLEGRKYQLVCTPSKKIKAHLDGTMATLSDNQLLVINMANSKEDFVDVDPSITNKLYPKKSSSGGLSGGAIAGIIIACVVALIAALVTAFLCNRNVKPPMQEASNLEINSSNSVKNIY